MDIVALLDTDALVILDESAIALERSHVPHYDGIGPAESRRRLESLFGQVRSSIDARDLRPIVSYGADVARERHAAGVDIGEVQTAFNVLEESLWRHVVAECDDDEVANSIAIVSTVLGAGKDALARTYVSLATSRPLPSLDVRAMFHGTQPAETLGGLPEQ